jgi:dihydropyrimidinase
VAGGTTTVMLFAEQSRGESIAMQVASYHTLANEQGAYADYGFHIIITDPTDEVLNKDLPLVSADGGVMSMKLYLTYEGMQLSDSQFLRALHKARELDMVALVHAENGDLIQFFEQQLLAQGLVEPKYKAVSHPREAESEAVNRAVTFSSVMDTPMLIVHVSVPESTSIIRKAQSLLKPVFAETCPQYLMLSKEKLAEEHFCGAKYVCSPPPRSNPDDVEAIWRGIMNGTFTILSSDHCPYRFDDPHGKKLGLGKSFMQIPNGLPGVETRMSILFSEGLVRRRCIDVKRFVELTSENPAKLYGLYPKKGAIQVGSDADIVVWHKQETFAPRRLSHAQHLHDACDYSPYEGVEFLNWPRMTLLRGKVVFRDGQVTGQLGYGQFVRRKPCLLPWKRRLGQEWSVLQASV